MYLAAKGIDTEDYAFFEQEFVKASDYLNSSRPTAVNLSWALKRMKVAQKLLQKHDAALFYDEVLRALWGYVGDKFNMSQESLNKENIAQALASRNVPEEQVLQFLQVLNDCEFARYAPGDENQNMENVYNSAIGAISKMEDSL